MQAKLAKFTAAARAQLRSCLAGFVSLPTSSVSIEGIKLGQCSPQPSPAVQPAKTDNTDDNCSKSSKHGTQEVAEASGDCLTTNGAAAGVTVAVHIQLGSAEEQGKQLVAALQAAPETVMRDEVLLAAVGMPGRPSLHAAIVNLTPAPSNMFTHEPRKFKQAQAAAIPSAWLVQVGLDRHAHSANQNLQGWSSVMASLRHTSHICCCYTVARCFTRKLDLETVVCGMQVARPKLEMVVPYKQYKLVHSDGSAPERTRKHPFCMSRVHYSAPGHSASLHKARQPSFMSGWHLNIHY